MEEQWPSRLTLRQRARVIVVQALRIASLANNFGDKELLLSECMRHGQVFRKHPIGDRWEAIKYQRRPSRPVSHFQHFGGPLIALEER